MGAWVLFMAMMGGGSAETEGDGHLCYTVRIYPTLDGTVQMRPTLDGQVKVNQCP